MIHLITGLIASMAHVISGPDHLAAVTPLAIESKKKSWIVGFFWGIGHTLGALIIGVLFLLFRNLIKVEVISTYSEQIVGVVLIVIGIWAIVRVFKENKLDLYGHTHTHTHEHSESPSHSHPHTHDHDHVHEIHKQNILTSLSVGIIHGLAGVSHIFGILPTLALPSKVDAVLYLGGFALGTIVVMILYSLVLGLISHKISEKNKTQVLRRLKIFGGILAIGVGIFWIATSI
jgi:ABC-type nickel/cobalt efflux system permease component RcnA